MTTSRRTMSGGIFLIGLGMLSLTGWWWPGILLVLGCAIAADRYVHGQTWQALGSLVLGLVVPLGIALTEQLNVPWHLVGPFVLIALGLMRLADTVIWRE